MQGTCRKGFFGSFLEETPGVPVAAIGLGLSILVKESSVLASFYTLGSEPSGVSEFFISSSFFLIMFLVFLKVPRLRLHRNPLVGFSIAALTSIALFVVYSQGALQPSEQIGSLFSIIQHLGGYLLLLMWCEMLYPLGARRFSTIFAVSTIVAAAVNLLSVLLKPEAARSIVAICPLVAITCLYLFKEYNASRGGRESDRFQGLATVGEYERDVYPLGKGCVVKRDHVFLVVAFLMFIACNRFSLSSVHFLWVSLQGIEGIPLSGQVANVIGASVAGILIYLVVLFFWNRNSLTVVSVLLLAVMFFSMNPNDIADTDQVMVFLIPMSAGEKLVYYLMMMSPFFLFTKNSPATLCGCVFSADLGVAVYIALTVGFTAALSRMVAVIMAGISVICIIGFFFAGDFGSWLRREDEISGVLFSPTSASAGVDMLCSLPEDMRESCLCLADTCQLTRRETEILLLLANRYNAQSIAEILVVTVATVKTHMRSVYLKIGVHSQKELLETIRGERDLII